MVILNYNLQTRDNKSHISASSAIQFYLKL